ncbi:MAG: flagellar protein FlgN [Clostridiaceae bacterium]|nr:flagellar protein FlgN [Eubacteriales bacterium]
MSAFLGELMEAMAAERDACMRLLELGKAKKDQLVYNRVTELNLTVRAESEAVKKLRTAAKRRQEALRAIALEHGALEELSFDDVLMLLPEERRAEAVGFKNSFREAVAELAGVNALNQRLIETQIQYTEFCLSMLAGGSQGLDTYENTGHVRGEVPALKSLIDTKA